MLGICENLQRAARGSGNPQALLEAALVRLALAEKMADVTALLPGAEGGGAAASAERGRNQGPSKKAPADNGTPSAERQRPAKGAGNAPEPKSAPPAGAPAETEAKAEGPKAAPPGAESQNLAGEDAAPEDAEALWESVLAQISDQRALGWIRRLWCASFDGNTAVLRARKGEAGVLRFATGGKRSQLEQLIGGAAGRRVRVELHPPAEEESQPDRQETDAPGAGTPRQQAMALPLVQAVTSVFDTTLRDVRRADPTRGQAPADDAKEEDATHPGPDEEGDKG
jgi:hypothetical protein